MVGREEEGREERRETNNAVHNHVLTSHDKMHMVIYISDSKDMSCVFMCGVCVCWSILGGLSGMLVGNRLEVIMVHNLPIIGVCTSFNLCSNQTYMERGLQSVEGGNRERG